MRLCLIILILLVLGCEYHSNPEISDDDKLRITLLLSQAEEIRNHQSDSSLLLAQEALLFSKRQEYPSGIAESSFIIGEICFDKGEYQKANTYLIESIHIFEMNRSFAALGRSYNLVGRIFQHNHQFGLAGLNYIKAKKMYKTINDSNGIAETYGNLGHLKEKMSHYDSAINYNLKALNLYIETSDSLGIARIYDNIGSVHEDQEEFLKARENFELAYKINLNIGNEAEAIINKNNIADTYRKRGEFDEALVKYKDVILEAKEINLPHQLKSGYQDVSQTYEKMGLHKLAFAYLDSCYEVFDQLASQEIARGVQQSRSVYELEENQRKIEILEKSRSLNQVIEISLSVLAILLIIIGLLIYTTLRARIRKEKAETKFVQIKQEQLESELTLKKVREKKMLQELENMSKELTANVLNIIRKNRCLTHLKNDLKKMKLSEDEKTGKVLKKLIKSIDFTFSVDDDWQEFETIFQKVHKDFFMQLSKQYPDLTSTETRLCAMMRLNLNSKDIATIMGISTDSLRIARYRLRKRLGMDKGANLYNFMMSMG